MALSGRGLTLALTEALAGRARGQIAGTTARREETQQEEDRQRAAMHDILSEQLLRGQVQDAATLRTRQARRETEVAASAAKIRASHRYPQLEDLPDEDLVNEVAIIEAEKQRARAYTNTPQGIGDRQTRDRLHAVERQETRTAADINAARRAAPKKPLIGFQSPADSAGFVRDSTAAADRVGGLQERADSLRQVGDSLAAVLEGGRAPTRPRKTRVTKDQADYLRAIHQWDPNRYEEAAP